MIAIPHSRQIAALELRAAAWCRREAMRRSGAARQADLHEARNRVAEAKKARLGWPIPTSSTQPGAS